MNRIAILTLLLSLNYSLSSMGADWRCGTVAAYKTMGYELPPLYHLKNASGEDIDMEVIPLNEEVADFLNAHKTNGEQVCFKGTDLIVRSSRLLAYAAKINN